MKKLKKKECTRQTGLLKMFVVLFLMMGMMIPFGCSEQRETMGVIETDTADFIRDHYYEMERTLYVSSSPDNQLAFSDANIVQTASVFYEEQNIRITPKPKLTLTVELSKPRIEVKTIEELPVTVVKHFIQSLTPYRKDLVFGEDGVKVWELSDGQVVTAKWSTRYDGVLVGKDTLATPHVQLSGLDWVSANYSKATQTVENEDPYQMVTKLKATLTPKGTSGQQVNTNVYLEPWYTKVITSEPMVVQKVSYDNSPYVGCPVTAYEIVEEVTTNKSTFTNRYQVNVNFNLSAPELRSQPSLDSLFATTSTGKLAEQRLSEVKNDDGFTIRTMTGSYVSVNTGREHRTAVESSVNFTYQIPVKFESTYGAYTIPAISLKFEEVGFSVTKRSEAKESKTFRSVNHIVPVFGTCTMDDITETVDLIVQVPKPDVVPKDSTYTLTGDGDEYIVDKEVTWSDGKTTHSKYTYQGRHSAKAEPFGEVVTTSLSWNASSLNRATQTKTTEEKKFSDVTKFTAVYETTTWKSEASNGVQNGIFTFKETVPTVTFTDGKVSKTFPTRRYTMNGRGAVVATNFNVVVRQAISYKAYDYNYKTQASFNGGAAEGLVSHGLLLMPADEAGEARYSVSGPTWSGNTGTVKVTKTTPHTYAEDEVMTWTKSLVVGLTNLTDGRLDAENTNFTVDETNSENSNQATDNPWVVNTRVRRFDYVLTNGKVSRTDLTTNVTDGTITFNDGTFQHVFDLKLNVSKNATLGTTTRSGNYNVTPHRLTVTAVNGSKSLSTTGTTSIYVKRDAEVTSHTEMTRVYNDGTVDAEITFTKDDGSTETIKASSTFGHRFAFNFTNTTAQEKVVSKVGHQGNLTIGNATSSSAKQGQWNVTEYRYAPTYVLDNGVTADKLTSGYGYSNYEFVYTDQKFGTIRVPVPQVSLTPKSLNIQDTGTAGGYQNHTAYVVLTGTAQGTEGQFNRDLSVSHILKIKVNEEPQTPHFGKPKSFMVTATYDPTAQVTQRAFCFQWENGVTYAVCPYETMLPNTSDFMYKQGSYQGYNSVAYDKNNATNHWQPARGVDETDAIRWFSNANQQIAAIDKAMTCMIIGWKNIVNGTYALQIPGYTYTMDGYNITVTAPNGQKVTFNSHYE